MTLRELMEWGMKFQMRRLQEETRKDAIKLICPECGGDWWEYDFEKKGHWCKKCDYFQKDL